MKAMQLTGLRRMELREVPKPVIAGERDVLIKMTHVGVCGSDVHYYLNGRIGSQVVKYPFAVGHEGAGIVESVGAAVTRVKPGDRIAIEPGNPCYVCDQCLAGRQHTCRVLTYLGCPGQAEGCLSEYIVMPETSCFLIPDGMTLEEAALSEPLSIGVYAVKQSVFMAGAKIGILGCGPIGLSVLLPALTQGAEKIYVTDKIDERLAVARTAGAGWTGNPLKADIVREIAVCEPLLLDVVFECCGQQEAVEQALEILKPGGKLMLIGIPETDHLEFNMDLMRRKEICVQNVRRQNHCVQAAIDMIARKDFDVNVMTTHRFPFEQTAAAFELAAEYRDGVIKAMIMM
ncbi:MAG: alcohol dehydrogenase catalytic domain-containing protein [Victivallaceae bacterium]